MKIKNWHKFQHFKDRKPPWIKLYRDILDDVEWHELDAQSAKILVMLWLIASEDDNGCLPSLKSLAFRLRVSETVIKSTVYKLSHWLNHEDIDAISSRYQDDAPETERETETEKRQKATVVATPKGVSQSVWEDFVRHRKAKKAQVTQTVIDGITKEAKKAGWPLEDALKETILRNWASFKADWVANKSFAFHREDIARVTVPGSTDPDPALLKIQQDREKATPMPAHIRQQINQVLRKV